MPKKSMARGHYNGLGDPTWIKFPLSAQKSINSEVKFGNFLEDCIGTSGMRISVIEPNPKTAAAVTYKGSDLFTTVSGQYGLTQDDSLTKGIINKIIGHPCIRQSKRQPPILTAQPRHDHLVGQNNAIKSANRSTKVPDRSTQAIKSPNRLTEVPDRSTPGTLLDFANTPATNLNLGQVLAMTNLNNALASQLNPLAAQLNPLAMQLNPLAAQLNPLAAQMAQVPSASNTNASTGTADLPSSPAPSDSNVVVSQSVSQATQSSVQSH
ncbi:hypothetical protein KEM48_001955 [Puccinia striiformis f. sp. tritici PST-130]|nr:hypothetical protein KEM48_001955 [Puccinia striiformis f. sp. tritici PST-130]